MGCLRPDLHAALSEALSALDQGKRDGVFFDGHGRGAISAVAVVSQMPSVALGSEQAEAARALAPYLCPISRSRIPVSECPLANEQAAAVVSQPGVG